MSSNNFLQRFKGKTQAIGKTGMQNVLGAKDQPLVTHANIPANTNSNFKTATSVNKTVGPPHKPSTNPKINNQIAHKSPSEFAPAVKPPKVENPFLVANPFYLDEEERKKDEELRKERARQEREKERENEREKQKEKQRENEVNKRAMKSSKSVEKRTGHEWVKMGGLGANIGGEEWMQRKKKIEKMQEFAEQVKCINSEKVGKLPPTGKPKEKESNARDKALQYSKNVPRPMIRLREEQPVPVQKQSNELSELEQYALKHEQLRNMLRNQL